MLITHFDLTPGGREAWITDKNGGISHCDFRAPTGERRRWVVQDQGRSAKLGGISVNREWKEQFESWRQPSHGVKVAKPISRWLSTDMIPL